MRWVLLLLTFAAPIPVFMLVGEIVRSPSPDECGVVTVAEILYFGGGSALLVFIGLAIATVVSFARSADKKATHQARAVRKKE